jgi:hypothetical protein
VQAHLLDVAPEPSSNLCGLLGGLRSLRGGPFSTMVRHAPGMSPLWVGPGASSSARFFDWWLDSFWARFFPRDDSFGILVKGGLLPLA